MSKFLNIIISLTVVILIFSFFSRDRMPEKNEIEPELFKDPIQTEIEKNEFLFNYREKRYYVKPIAEYELWGIIVTENNIKAWYNFYHDKDSVNIKDVCVVWGENINSGVYKEMKFSSGEWTCYPGSRFGTDSAAWGKYKGNKLSNNHLLSENQKVREIINKASIGDQIHFKGYLADYGTSKDNYFRRTSISRDDTNQSSRSGGACEVVFVEKMEILKKGNPVWHLLFNISIYLLILSVLIKIIIVIKEAHKLNKASEQVEKL